MELYFPRCQKSVHSKGGQGNLQHSTWRMWENSKSCSKVAKCRDHEESWRTLMAICKKWYFFLGMGQARKWEYLMHNPHSHLSHRSFSSPLLIVHCVAGRGRWLWKEGGKETPTANLDRLWRLVMCYFCELLAVIETDSTLPFHVFIVLNFHTTTFTPLSCVPPVHLTYPSFP